MQASPTWSVFVGTNTRIVLHKVKCKKVWLDYYIHLLGFDIMGHAQIIALTTKSMANPTNLTHSLFLLNNYKDTNHINIFLLVSFVFLFLSFLWLGTMKFLAIAQNSPGLNIVISSCHM